MSTDRNTDLAFGTEPTVDARKERINQQGYLPEDLGLLAAHAVAIGGRDASDEDVRAAHATTYGAGFPELRGFEVQFTQQMMREASIVVEGREYTI